MVDNNVIKQMLEKADAHPFYYGGGDESYFWRAAEIDGEIFAERHQVVDGEVESSYYHCYSGDFGAKRDLYDGIVIDFVVYYRATWKFRERSDVFECTAGPEDEGLLEILSVFHRKYASFVNDVLYWFSVVLEVEPDERGVCEIAVQRKLDADERLVKRVLDRLALNDPIVVAVGDVKYCWQIVKAHGELWFLRSTWLCRDEYIFFSDEYGHVPLDESDALDALRDAVRDCFSVDNWELIDTDTDVDSMLALVDLTMADM